MSIRKSITKLKKNIEMNHPIILPYLLMIQRQSLKTVNNWDQEKFIDGVMKCYKRHLGYTFDIHNPVLFTEKLQWYKVFYQRNDFGRITDKVLFKDYIKEIIGDGFTIPMYRWWDNTEDIAKDWDQLPHKFVLKSNLQSDGRGILIVNNKEKENYTHYSKLFRSWLDYRNTLINSWDYKFYDSTPKILAEQFMQDEYGELRDYKFFCFDGKVACFRVDYGRKEEHHATFFDSNKKEMDVVVPTFPPNKDIRIVLPSQIDKMFSMAEVLSKGFPFIRVDFFCCNNRLFVAEMTFAPGGGVTPYPLEFNKWLGEWFKLPK